MSWQVIYHYADEAAALPVFDGTAKAYDRADRLELINPAGEVVDTLYVTDDAAIAAGYAGRGEDGYGVPSAAGRATAAPRSPFDFGTDAGARQTSAGQATADDTGQALSPGAAMAAAVEAFYGGESAPLPLGVRAHAGATNAVDSPATRYRLVNTEALHAAHPDTFWIAARAVRADLQVGQYAKLCFEPADGSGGGERMWVLITAVDENGYYTGTLDNNPFDPEGLGVQADDTVSFGPEHIYDLG